MAKLKFDVIIDIIRFINLDDLFRFSITSKQHHRLVNDLGYTLNFKSQIDKSTLRYLYGIDKLILYSNINDFLNYEKTNSFSIKNLTIYSDNKDSQKTLPFIKDLNTFTTNNLSYANINDENVIEILNYKYITNEKSCLEPDLIGLILDLNLNCIKIITIQIYKIHIDSIYNIIYNLKQNIGEAKITFIFNYNNIERIDLYHMVSNLIENTKIVIEFIPNCNIENDTIEFINNRIL